TLDAAVTGTLTGDINLNTITSGDVVIAAPVTTGSGNVSVTSAGNITFSDFSPVVSGGIATSGDVNLTANSGLIQESGTGIISGGLLTTSSKNGTLLDNTNTVSSFHATNSTTGDISLANAAATLTVTGIDQTGGLISVRNTGNLTTTGTVVDHSDAQSITLVTQSHGAVEIQGLLLSTGGDITVLSLDSLNIAQNISTGGTSAGTVRLNAAGSIIEAPANSGSAATITSNALGVSTSAGDIYLHGANAVNVLAAANSSLGGAIIFNNSIALTIDTVTHNAYFGAPLPATTTNDVVGVQTNGGIISIVADSLTTQQKVWVTATGTGPATVISDFNSGNAVNLIFTSKLPGEIDDGITLVFTKSSTSNSAEPSVKINGKTIAITLSTNPLNFTTANDLKTALDKTNNIPISTTIIGNGLANIAGSLLFGNGQTSASLKLDRPSLNLTAQTGDMTINSHAAARNTIANYAGGNVNFNVGQHNTGKGNLKLNDTAAVSTNYDFNSQHAVDMTFVSRTGESTVLVFVKDNATTGLPTVNASDPKMIVVTFYTGSNNVTTATQLKAALDAAVGATITTTIEGDGNTNIAQTMNYDYGASSTSLALNGMPAAKAFYNFDLPNGFYMTFTSKSAGTSGDGTKIVFVMDSNSNATTPSVNVSADKQNPGKSIITIGLTARTTAEQLQIAIANKSEANKLISTSISGDKDTVIGAALAPRMQDLAGQKPPKSLSMTLTRQPDVQIKDSAMFNASVAGNVLYDIPYTPQSTTIFSNGILITITISGPSGGRFSQNHFVVATYQDDPSGYTVFSDVNKVAAINGSPPQIDITDVSAFGGVNIDTNGNVSLKLLSGHPYDFGLNATINYHDFTNPNSNKPFYIDNQSGSRVEQNLSFTYSQQFGLLNGTTPIPVTVTTQVPTNFNIVVGDPVQVSTTRVEFTLIPNAAFQVFNPQFLMEPEMAPPIPAAPPPPPVVLVNVLPQVNPLELESFPSAPPQAYDRFGLPYLQPVAADPDAESPAPIELPRDAITSGKLAEIFKKLPDGHYKILLRVTNNGDIVDREILDVYIRQGQPISFGDLDEAEAPTTSEPDDSSADATSTSADADLSTTVNLPFEILASQTASALATTGAWEVVDVCMDPVATIPAGGRFIAPQPARATAGIDQRSSKGLALPLVSAALAYEALRQRVRPTEQTPLHPQSAGRLTKAGRLLSQLKNRIGPLTGSVPSNDT
ncbi:MAG: hypothetical protein JSS02_16780, partial [Planctomycetes bacterium]|nr:hypothetical protein [Planctomycetota bacterium]